VAVKSHAVRARSVGGEQMFQAAFEVAATTSTTMPPNTRQTATGNAQVVTVGSAVHGT
jgi:hypothetical protein